MIKFGIVGCGMIASINAEAIDSIPSAKLVGVADTNFDLACSFAKKRTVKAYENYDDMLADDEIDAVIVCTPSCFHAQNAIDALKSGKHVVLEKPMAIKLEDADKIIKAVNETGNTLTVVSQFRFSRDLLKVKRLIEKGAFGKISLCSLSMRYYRSPEYYSTSAWKGTLKFDGGGALINQGIHGIDLLQYLAGDVKSVTGVTRTLAHDVEVEDTATALVEFVSGALGTIVASTCAYPGFERKIEINGDKGFVILRENRIERLMIDGKEQDVTITDYANASSDPTNITCDEHKAQLENFISAIKGEEKLLVDCYEGRKALRIIEEIYRQNGR